MLGVQITFGTGMIVLTTVIHVAGLIGLANMLPGVSDWVQRYSRMLVAGLLLVTSVLWIVAMHILESLIWALLYVEIGEFDNLAAALYFSVVTATTLGYGDLLLSAEWRLLSSFEAMGGLILFGASTAFLLALMGRVFKKLEPK